MRHRLFWVYGTWKATKKPEGKSTKHLDFVLLQVSIMLHCPAKFVQILKKVTKGTVRRAISSYFTVRTREQRALEERLPGTISSVFSREFNMEWSSSNFFKNNAADAEIIFPDRTRDDTKHYLLHGPSRSLMCNKVWSNVLSPVAYHRAKHHEGDS